MQRDCHQFFMLLSQIVKNKRSIFRLLTANMISGFTQGLNMIAIPWYFINIAGAGSIFGIIFSVITFITIFWTLYAGTLVDRYNRKRIFLAINITGFLFVFSFGLYGWLNQSIPLWMVGAVFMFSIFVFNIHFPSMYAFSQEITEPQYYGRINSIIEIQAQTASMLAGAMAVFLLGGTAGKLNFLESQYGIYIEPWHIYDIFLLDGITYLIAFVIILPMKYVSLKDRFYEHLSLKERFKTGLRFLKKNKVIFWYGILTFSIFIVTIVEGFYLAAIYVTDYLHEDAVIYTIIEIFYAFGAVMAGFFVQRTFKTLHPIKAIIIIMVIVAIGLFIVGATRSNIIFIAFNFMLGLSNAGSRILRVSYLFTLVPNQVIGRVNSLFASYQTLLRGLFLALFSLPFFMEGDNITVAYYIFGVFVVITIVMLAVLTKPLIDKNSANGN
jgi:MFS family permease